jgi:hypothetical protein
MGWRIASLVAALIAGFFGLIWVILRVEEMRPSAGPSPIPDLSIFGLILFGLFWLVSLGLMRHNKSNAPAQTGCHRSRHRRRHHSRSQQQSFKMHQDSIMLVWQTHRLPSQQITRFCLSPRLLTKTSGIDFIR